MGSVTEIVVTLPGKRRVDAQVGAHAVHTDQPVSNGGEDTAPSPFELFLASIGTCAGIFVQGFCAKRDIPFEGIRLIERPAYGPDGALASIDLEVQFPPSFPEKYRDAVLKVVEQCSVKKAIQTQPEIKSRWTVAKEPNRPAAGRKGRSSKAASKSAGKSAG